MVTLYLNKMIYYFKGIFAVYVVALSTLQWNKQILQFPHFYDAALIDQCTERVVAFVLQALKLNIILNLLGEGGGLPETFFFLNFWKENQQFDTWI